jgi:hypothetical protein
MVFDEMKGSEAEVLNSFRGLKNKMVRDISDG